MDLPMKAWVIAHNGAPAKALSLRTVSAPRPPRRAEVLVRVTHAALNPADHAYLKVIPSWLPNRWGAATGLDFAGEVVAAGPDVPAGSPVGKGAKVCGALSVPLVFWGAGSLAEYVTVPAALVVPQPEGWGGARSAGGFGVASQTAHIMVKAAGGRGRLGPGARVMVIGASGGVGSVLVQVASNLGAEVVGVCSAGNHEMVQKLGAAEMVDYTAHNPLPKHLAQEYGSRQFDFIFDCVGSHHIYVGSPAYLKPEGAFINIAGDPANAIGIMAGLFLPRFLGGVPRRYKMLALSPSGDNAREVAKWVQDGLLKEILIDSEYSMDDAVKAMDRVGSKRSKGKVVVRVAE